MTETLTEKLDYLKNLFAQLKEGVYSGRQIPSIQVRSMAYSEFEICATILKDKYSGLSEQEAKPLLEELKCLETEFRNYQISFAEKNYKLQELKQRLAQS